MGEQKHLFLTFLQYFKLLRIKRKSDKNVFINVFAKVSMKMELYEENRKPFFQKTFYKPLCQPFYIKKIELVF